MKSGQRGVILISALILVALAAIVATSLFFETALSARRAAASFSMEQAMQLGAGGEALAAFAIADDKNSDDTDKDAWAQHYGPVEVENGVTLEAQVSDEQGKFNLNTLLRKDGTSRSRGREGAGPAAGTVGAGCEVGEPHHRLDGSQRGSPRLMAAKTACIFPRIRPIAPATCCSPACRSCSSCRGSPARCT